MKKITAVRVREYSIGIGRSASKPITYTSKFAEPYKEKINIANENGIKLPKQNADERTWRRWYQRNQWRLDKIRQLKPLQLIALPKQNVPQLPYKEMLK